MIPRSMKGRAVARAASLALAAAVAVVALPACDNSDGNPGRESISVPRNGGGGKGGVEAPGATKKPGKTDAAAKKAP